MRGTQPRHTAHYQLRWYDFGAGLQIAVLLAGASVKAAFTAETSELCRTTGGGD